MFSGGFKSLEGKERKLHFHEGRVTCGRFAGKTYDWLLEHNPGYIVWAYTKLTDHGLRHDQYQLAALAKEQADELKKEEDRYVRTAGTSYEGFWSEHGDKD